MKVRYTLVLVALAALALGAAPALASEACLGDSVAAVVGDGLDVTHPNIPQFNGTVYAGTYLVTIDGNGPFETYCTDIVHPLCLSTCLPQAPDPAPEVIWIIENYYPVVPGEPAALATDAEKAAAVQVAIWHFTDGIDF
jgi:TQXA domain-containing protein